jgi:hypothetical protein
VAVIRLLVIVNKWHDKHSSSKICYEKRDMNVSFRPNSSFMQNDLESSLMHNHNNPSVLASTDFIHTSNKHGERIDNKTVRTKVIDGKQFHQLMDELTSKDDPNLSSSNRRSRQVRDEKYKTIDHKLPLTVRRERILFDEFEENPGLSSEIKTSLQILKQVKAQNEKYLGNEKPIINKLNQTTGPSSITQKFKQRQNEQNDKSKGYAINFLHSLRTQNISEITAKDSSTDLNSPFNPVIIHKRTNSHESGDHLVNQFGKNHNYKI